MKILHLSDIHIGSGFSHGRVNPATGLHPAIDITGITNLSIPTTPPADTNPVTVGVS